MGGQILIVETSVCGAIIIARASNNILNLVFAPYVIILVFRAEKSRIHDSIFWLQKWRKIRNIFVHFQKSTPRNVVKNTTKFMLTLAFCPFIIKVAFEHKCYAKAKNKHLIQKYNSTLHMKNRLYSQLPVLLFCMTPIVGDFFCNKKTTCHY